MSASGAALPDLLLPRTTSREVGVWVMAGALVFALHAAAFHQAREWEPEDAPAERAAMAIMIDLAPMAVTPEAVPANVAELVESMEVRSEVRPTETAETLPADAPLPSDMVEKTPPRESEQAMPLESETVETAQTEPVEPVEAEPIETPAQEVEPLDPEVAEEMIPDHLEAPLPEVAMAIPVPRPEVVEAEPDPKPAAKKPVQKKATEKPAKKEVSKREAKPAVAAKASAQDASKAAAPRPTEGGKSRGESPARWQSRVNAHLNRFKRYPAGERETGAAAVRFSIDASGRVLSAALARSSGNLALDKAAVDMVRRASPVPAPPPAIAKARMSLTVPVRFSRR